MVAKLVPELLIDDLDRSLAFYVGVVGFRVLYDRPEERFAYLDLGGAHLMLEQMGVGRRFRVDVMEPPYGRGVSFQIEVADVDALHGRVHAAGVGMVLPLEERWYRRDEWETGNRQFVVADPDGYLMRFYANLGQRPPAR